MALSKLGVVAQTCDSSTSEMEAGGPVQGELGYTFFKTRFLNPAVVAHTFNLSTWEAEAGGSLRSLEHDPSVLIGCRWESSQSGRSSSGTPGSVLGPSPACVGMAAEAQPLLVRDRGSGARSDEETEAKREGKGEEPPPPHP
ncbi:hypothetical protein U0070_005200 [Myodes glareolus]|uniref:Uncharacterized protein n=1 Tax=Myodes glareolus TaxID=447135 RepID=A0AAW0IG87_MYOGA